MPQALDDTSLPLEVRVTLANAALAYANATAAGFDSTDPDVVNRARAEFLRAASDVRICRKAQEFGMV